MFFLTCAPALYSYATIFITECWMKVSKRSPELRPLTSGDLKENHPGLWNKISGRVRTYCKIGPSRKKPVRKNANLLPPDKQTKLPSKPSNNNDIVKEPIKETNNKETSSEPDKKDGPNKEVGVKSDVKKDDKKEDNKETDNKSKNDTKKDTKKPSDKPNTKDKTTNNKDNNTANNNDVKKGCFGRAGARLKSCFKRKKNTGPGLMARMNCFKARKRKTINKDAKPSFWKKMSCFSCACCVSCKTCMRGNKAAPENNNKKPGKATRKSSLMGFPKLDAVLVEHNSVMRGAIPVLPLPLAWMCLLLNVFLPGIGTLVSGLFCLCFGKPRFSVDDTSLARFGAFCVNFLVAISQTFTILFCLVGWGWSIWWGVIMIKLARKNKRIKQAESKTAEAQETNKNRDVEAVR